MLRAAAKGAVSRLRVMQATRRSLCAGTQGTKDKGEGKKKHGESESGGDGKESAAGGFQMPSKGALGAFAALSAVSFGASMYSYSVLEDMRREDHERRLAEHAESGSESPAPEPAPHPMDALPALFSMSMKEVWVVLREAVWWPGKASNDSASHAGSGSGAYKSTYHVAGEGASPVDENGEPVDADIPPGAGYYLGGVPGATVEEELKLPPSFTSPQGYVPRTLVVNLDETVVCTKESLLSGVAVQLRPGAREFLGHLAQLYEIVVFSDGRRDTLDEICHALDPEGKIIAHRLNMAHLVRDPQTGDMVKDIRVLNRNPSRVIIVDKTVAPGSEFNTILVPKWHGDLEDRSLLYIMQFLEHLVVDNVPDFRQEVLDNGGAIVAPAMWLGKKVQNAKKPPGMRGMLGAR